MTTPLNYGTLNYPLNNRTLAISVAIKFIMRLC